MNPLDYYLGPTGIPDKIRAAGRALNYLNPVNALGESMQASRRLFAPDTDGWGRVQATGDMLTGMAGVVAPSAVASRAGMSASNALQEGLMGFAYSPGVRMAADDAGRFVADEDGAAGVVDLGAARAERQRNDLISGIRRAIDDVQSGTAQARKDQAGFDLHRQGSLPLQQGVRVKPPSGWDMPGDWTVDGYWVDPQDANRFGYNLTNAAGETYQAPVSDPRIGYRTDDPQRFGGGFEAFYGPSSSRPAYGELPTRPEQPRRAMTPEDQRAIDAEFGELFGPSLNPAETRAQNVLDYLTSGRASEVTDEMLEGADPQYLWRNYDMPMDEASRVGRAQDMGLVDDQYHATTAAFDAFHPSDTGLAGRGVYTGDYPDDVSVYATARMEGSDRTGLNLIPVRAPSDASYAPNITYQRAADADPEWGYNATMEENIAGMRRVADRLSGEGYAGVRSQPGERVTFDPRNIRSRFARFDPRLAHLRNLSAGIGALGLFGDYDQRDNAFGSQ